MSFNKVILMGNLTRDPEVRTLPSGNACARLALAVNRTYADRDGNRKEEVTFVDVDAFGKQAEVIGKFFTKGKPILVEGRLKLDSWEDKTTREKKSRLGVVLEGFSFVGSGGGKGDSDSERRGDSPRGAAGKPGPGDAPAHDGGDEDVPF